MKRLVIIEDQTAIREMLAEILRLDNHFQLVGEAGEGQAALQLCLETKPDVAGPRRQAAGPQRRRPAAPAGQAAPRHAGARVFRPRKSRPRPGDDRGRRARLRRKDRGPDRVQEGHRAGGGGGTYFGPAVAALLRNVVANPQASNSPDFLTDREREILKLVAESHSTKDIAAKLAISMKTVDNHRTNLMRKLNLHDVASLTRYALDIGVIPSRGDELSARPRPAKCTCVRKGCLQ